MTFESEAPPIRPGAVARHLGQRARRGRSPRGGGPGARGPHPSAQHLPAPSPCARRRAAKATPHIVQTDVKAHDPQQDHDEGDNDRGRRIAFATCSRPGGPTLWEPAWSSKPRATNTGRSRSGPARIISSQGLRPVSTLRPRFSSHWGRRLVVSIGFGLPSSPDRFPLRNQEHPVAGDAASDKGSSYPQPSPPAPALAAQVLSHHDSTGVAHETRWPGVSARLDLRLSVVNRH